MGSKESLFQAQHVYNLAYQHLLEQYLEQSSQQIKLHMKETWVVDLGSFLGLAAFT